MISFDIETEPLPEKELLEMLPEFDESSVKVGNLKDPTKIKAKIDAAKESHQQRFVEKAALSATTGRVLAVGYYDSETAKFVIDAVHGKSTEQSVIASFWTAAHKARMQHDTLVGLNIFDFDLPFLMRRSWILDIDVPGWVIIQDRYFTDYFIDLRRKWLCGQNPQQTLSSFAELGRAFGTGGKNVEDVSGADFHRMFHGTEQEKAKAIEYLKNDVRQPVRWAHSMGIF